MYFSNISLRLLLLVLLTIIKSQADSSACERKEKHLASLDVAKEAILKAKDLQPSCVKDSKDISSNSSECGAKAKVSAYLHVAKILLDGARETYTACDEAKNLSKVVHFHNKPTDCSEILENGESVSGEYIIWPRNRIFNGMQQLKVYCDMDTDGGGWTLIQRRGNFSNKIDFYRDWNDYKNGFGNISEEFWLGNNNIFALTNQGNYIARFDMMNLEKEYRFATYSSFWLEDEIAGYKWHFDKYFGTAGDGIRDLQNMKFSTKDKKNYKSTTPCTTTKGGGWWYNNCGYSNPNGLNELSVEQSKKNMNWYPLTKYGSLLSIEIKIRSEK